MSAKNTHWWRVYYLKKPAVVFDTLDAFNIFILVTQKSPTMLQNFEKCVTAQINETFCGFQKFILQVRHLSDRVNLVLRPP